MATKRCGNILEADIATRASFDSAILAVARILEQMGVEMMTAYELSKRFDSHDPDHRLQYVFIPKHPHSPGTLSEWQGRWIIGHYPEDFAAVCRAAGNALI